METGFDLLDNALGKINNNDLLMIQGNCIQAERFIISLMQSILDHNDGYVVLLNAKDFRELTLTVFDDFPADDDISLISSRLTGEHILKRNLTVTEPKLFTDSLNSWLKTKKYEHLQNKNMLAVFIKLPKHLAGNEADFIAELKKFAQSIETPVFYQQEFKIIDYDVADKIIKISAVDDYKEPIKVTVTKPQSSYNVIEVNKESLKYSENLRDCKELWFHEDQ